MRVTAHFHLEVARVCRPAARMVPGAAISSEPQYLVRKVKRFRTYAETPLQRLEQGLHPRVAYLVLPLVTLANADITLPSSLDGLLDSPVTMGVLPGLAVGKPVGILGTSWLMTRLGHGGLGPSVHPRSSEGTHSGQTTAAADLLGVQDTTLLAVRPDGYIGLRADGDHLGARERYRTLVHAGHP